MELKKIPKQLQGIRIFLTLEEEKPEEELQIAPHPV